MSILKSILGTAGGIFGGPLGSILGGAAAGLLGGKGPKEQSATTQQRLDPRAEAIIYGDGKTGQHGLLTQYQQLGQKPQDSSLSAFERANLNYLEGTAPQNLAGIQNAGAQLLNGQNAPSANAAQIGGAAFAKGNMVQAPSQNGMDLSGSYNDFINGPRGDNKFLTSAIQGGIDQSKNMFGQMQSQATENLMENIMPSIRSNSVLSGQYGGSRQGVAEGNAIGDFAKAQQQVINQFGQNNTNAAVGAQANAYETDSNRALSATQGLGAQQYGVAQQDAATKNAAEFMNVNQANQNYATNAAMQQQANMANLGAQQNQNQLNQAGKLAGAGLLSGQMGQAYSAGQNHDNYALNRAGQVNNLMSPYLSQGGSTTSTQPLHSNTAGNLLGGAMAGLGIYNQFNQATGSPRIGANDGMGTGMNYNFSQTPLSTNSNALQNLNFLGG